jgi:hypothetical protein
VGEWLRVRWDADGSAKGGTLSPLLLASALEVTPQQPAASPADGSGAVTDGPLVDFLLRLDSAWLTPLGPAQRRILAGRLSTRSYRVGEVLAREGDVGRCLFVLLSGAVTATQGRHRNPDVTEIYYYVFETWHAE